jgi:hypothetical protein
MRLNRTDDLFRTHAYPTTSEELIEAYGEYVLDLPNGEESIAAVLGRSGPETFESPEDVQLTLFAAVGHQAVGRRFYSDRDPAPVSEGGLVHESF